MYNRYTTELHTYAPRGSNAAAIRDQRLTHVFTSQKRKCPAKPTQLKCAISRFKILCPLGRAGSSPASAISKKQGLNAPDAPFHSHLFFAPTCQWGQFGGNIAFVLQLDRWFFPLPRKECSIMASLEKRNGWYRLIFRLDGEKFSKSLNTESKRAAEACLVKVKDSLHRYELGMLTIPKGADPLPVLLNGQPKKPTAKSSPKRRKSVTIKKAWQVFQDTLPENSLEKNTLSGMATHVDHLARLIGRRVKISKITKPTLQQYIDDRSKEPGRYGNSVSVQTIKKELRTFSTIWGRMRDRKLVGHAFPNRKLRYPKFQEKPPFQTWQQIESRIKRGNLTRHQIKELWDALFLSVSKIEEVLSHIKTTARRTVMYPMFCFAAYTGARRSEILRSELEDLDFDSSTITIREKKRMRGKLSTRRVPMQPKLRAVLKDWLEIHPGSTYTFATIRWRAVEATAVTHDQASDIFEKAFAKSKWENKIKGYHVFRHSFCSNAAAAGIDQRVIRQWVGHQTEEMMRRYLHLFPNNELKDIQKVFS